MRGLKIVTVEMDDRALMLGTILKCFKTNISFCAHEQTINCLYFAGPNTYEDAAAYIQLKFESLNR